MTVQPLLLRGQDLLNRSEIVLKDWNNDTVTLMSLCKHSIEIIYIYTVYVYNIYIYTIYIYINLNVVKEGNLTGCQTPSFYVCQ